LDMVSLALPRSSDPSDRGADGDDSGFVSEPGRAQASVLESWDPEVTSVVIEKSPLFRAIFGITQSSAAPSKDERRVADKLDTYIFLF
jgi:hypothetical protein